MWSSIGPGSYEAKKNLVQTGMRNLSGDENPDSTQFHLMEKSQQHPKDFPSGHPPQYYPGLATVNFGVRMGSGTFDAVWPLTRFFTVIKSTPHPEQRSTRKWLEQPKVSPSSINTIRLDCLPVFSRSRWCPLAVLEVMYLG